MIELLRLLLAALIDALRSRHRGHPDTPVTLALRHQLRVLERKVGKPAWQPADRILLAGLSRLL